MKTTCILGSPRRGGNSDVLAGRFSEQARLHKAEIKTYTLSDINYKGCINLFDCKTRSTKCGQVDGLSPVLESIAQSQVLVMASPIYFTNITGPMKLVIDRFFSFFVPDYPTAEIKTRLSPNRHVVLIQTQGEPENRYADVFEQYSMSFKGLGFENMHLIRAWGVREPADVLAYPEFFNQCDAVVKTIYS